MSSSEVFPLTETCCYPGSEVPKSVQAKTAVRRTSERSERRGRNLWSPWTITSFWSLSDCMSNCFVRTSVAPQFDYKMSHALWGVNLAVKTSETVALFFLDFVSLRTDFFLDNIAPQHINVLKFLFVKAALFGPVICFTLATCIGAMDVTVCLSHSLRTQDTLHLPSGTFPVKLFWGLSCCFKWLLSHVTPWQVWCGRNIGLRSNKTT